MKLSRNLFFYNVIGLKDNFETKINILFFHFSILIISLKKKGKKDYTQQIFDDLFLNLENHIRELGYGDVAVNKKMKLLTKIFYDILIKINKSKDVSFQANVELFNKHIHNKEQINIYLEQLEDYFNSFYNFCLELNIKDIINGDIKFKYKNGCT